ncbi:hypothetical protein PACTADRAFT_48750 [Pachysolen tannophilus NRRL Y-2460]|uniref:Uncharacterized protein n=1 Tax=Pachysolen tannophilus NRRL Y-2460 TaxID=669874 RepID=A0A1E4TZ02_PACTA|nr:hypothetical protein PACTADRAFT_48750 [Pachysolen tannophilus NRRL Y-2460]
MARPRLILLLRHGESESNRDKSVNCHTPNHKISLTKKGCAEALAAGNRLVSTILKDDDTVLFYTSPYFRARQTLEGVIEGGKFEELGIKYHIREEPRMREQDFGNFQGSSLEMEKIWKERAHYGHFFYRIPYGESGADCYDRVASFNESLFRQFKNDDFPSVLVLITHGIWMRVFLMKWYRWSVEEFESLRNLPHCQYIVMAKNKDKENYNLQTKLRKWDDLPDDQINQKDVEKEFADEVNFNTYKAKLDDKKILEIVNAEKEAIRSQREKEKQIREMFKKSHH